MPQIPPGALFGDQRYALSKGTEEGPYWSHPCEVKVPALAGAPADARLLAEVKSVNYRGTFDARLGESFPAFVARRRAELKRERDLLAGYHEATAHLPQVIDWVEGENLWDQEVRNAGLAAGEPALLLRQVRAEPLTALGSVSVDEAVSLAGRLVMLLRVFHTPCQRFPTPHYFVTLGPDDVLVARERGGLWFRNLWKLRTQAELNPAMPLPCDEQLRGFVSPAAWPLLTPRTPMPPAPGGTPFAANLDLYSVGAIVVYLLLGSPDLTRPAPDWPGPKAVDAAARARGLPGPVADFLRKLLTHQFEKAQDALDEWAKVRNVRPPAPYSPPPTPSRKALTEPGFDDDTLVGGRYRITQPLNEGGMGCVYLAEDTRTTSRVVLKVTRYRRKDGKLLDYAPGRPEAILARREEMVREAQIALRAQGRTGAVPQVIDVALVPTQVPEFAAEPKLAGATEPVLVMEFIPGVPLRHHSVKYAEEDLLVLARGLCSVLADLHRPDPQGNYYLYVDWKPENVVRHTESGTFTLIDLGAAVEILAATGEFREEFTSTDLYAGQEEMANGQVNRKLRPPYDLHGVAAVCWRLAAVYTDPALQASDNDLFEERVKKGRPRSLLPELQFLPPDFRQLGEVLERALRPDPADRFQSADEMAAAAVRGLGRLSKLPPEPPVALAAAPVARPGGCDVELVCRLPYDPFCETLLLFRGDQPPGDARGTPWREVDLTRHRPGQPVTVRDDAVPDTWNQAHYLAATRGYNGERSEGRAASTMLLTDPERVTVEPVEGGLVLRWKVPDGVLRNNGEVVVERLPDRTRLPLAGPTASEFTDAGLDPTAEYRYRLFSKLTYGDSPGVEVSGRPWPVFARVQDMTAEPDDHRVRLTWTMTPGAASEVVFLRSQSPLAPDEIGKAASRASFTPVRFQLDAALRIVGVDDRSATVAAGPDGLLYGEWVDTTAVPGVEYHYTPLFRFRDHPKPKEWVVPAVKGAAFAEAPRFDAAPLPGAVRLSWDLPDRAVRARVTRAATADAPAISREFAPGQTAWVDRDPPAAGASYECRVQVGPSWSRGVTRDATPAEALPPLPAAPAPVPAVTAVAARGSQGLLEVRWAPPPGARGVLLTLPGHGRGQFVAAGAPAAWKFDNLPPGTVRAEARVVGADHWLSPPARAEGVVT